MGISSACLPAKQLRRTKVKKKRKTIAKREEDFVSVPLFKLMIVILKNKKKINRIFLGILFHFFLFLHRRRNSFTKMGHYDVWVT